MNYIQAIVLSFVEGVTEFLPISSTGHLILASKVLSIPQTEFVKSFEITIQLGAILAVVVLYSQTLVKNREIWKRVLVAFIPTGVLGFLVYQLVKTFLLGNVNVVIASLFLGGIAMLILEGFFDRKQKQTKSIENLSAAQSTAIGIIQSIAMIPGVSRAAATIIGGLLLGLKRQTIVEFSFLLAVPTMLAATGLDLFKSASYFSASQFGVLGIGFICSFIAAIAGVKFLLRYIKNNSFVWFGVYRIALALVFWTLFKNL